MPTPAEIARLAGNAARRPGFKHDGTGRRAKGHALHRLLRQSWRAPSIAMSPGKMVRIIKFEPVLGDSSPAPPVRSISVNFDGNQSMVPTTPAAARVHFSVQKGEFFGLVEQRRTGVFLAWPRHPIGRCPPAEYLKARRNGPAGDVGTEKTRLIHASGEDFVQPGKARADLPDTTSITRPRTSNADQIPSVCRDGRINGQGGQTVGHLRQRALIGAEQDIGFGPSLWR